MSTLQEHQNVLFELLEEFDRVCKKNNIPYMVFCGTALGAVRHKGIIPWDDDLDVAMLREDYECFLKIAPNDLKEQYYLQAEDSPHWPMNFSKLRKNNTTCLEKFYPKDNKMHQGIYIDIFPCDNAADREWVRKLQFYVSRILLAKALGERGYATDSKLKKIFIAFCGLLPSKPFKNFVMRKKNKKSQCVQTFLSCTSKYNKGIYSRLWLERTIKMEFGNLQVPVSAYYDELLTTLYGDYMTLPSVEERKIKEHAILIDTECDYSEYEHYRDGMVFDVHTRNIH